MEDEFESLRKKSTRSSTIYEEMEVEDGSEGSAFSQFIAGLTPGQRLLLSLLLFANVVMLGFACLVISGVINF